MAVKKKKKREEEPELAAERKIVEDPSFIKQREKRAHALIQQGSSQRAARAQAGQEIRGAKSAVELTKIEKERRERKGAEFLEKKGFFEEERPEDVTELDIRPRETGEKLPLLGTAGRVLAEKVPMWASPLVPFMPSLKYAAKKGWFGKDVSEEEVETLIQNPETAREMALQAIQQEVLNEGLTAAENFGAIVEAVPVAGGAVDKYAGRMLEDPKGNVDTIVGSITGLGTIAMNTREKVLTGKAGDPFKVYDMLLNMEDKLAAMEMRIKLLLNESAVLQADADQVNRIELAILDARLRVSDAKGSAAAGMIAPASDANVFLTLKRIEEKYVKGGKTNEKEMV